jgi:hypothetical protein
VEYYFLALEIRPPYTPLTGFNPILSRLSFLEIMSGGSELPVLPISKPPVDVSEKPEYSIRKLDTIHGWNPLDVLSYDIFLVWI